MYGINDTPGQQAQMLELLRQTYVLSALRTSEVRMIQQDIIERLDPASTAL